MKKPGEVVFLIFILGMSIFLFVESLKFPFIVTGNLGAGVWPAAITGLLILIITSTLVIDFQKRIRYHRAIAKQDKETITTNENDGSIEFDSGDIKKMISFVTVIFLYILMLQYIGFVFSTPIFVAALLKIQNQRLGFYYYLLYTIGSTLMLSVVFSYFFHIYPPRGIGIFRVLSRALY